MTLEVVCDIAKMGSIVNRRYYLKLSGFGLFFCCLLGTAACSSSSALPPNIVLILVDDLGWRDLGFMGSEFYQTPHLDRFAQQGMVFSQAYVTCPNCAPSRASLLTGMYTPRHGIYTVNNPDRGESRHRKLIPIENQTQLDFAWITLAEVLGTAGYVSASIGKWHLGELPGYGPLKQGFDLNVAGNHKGHPPAGYFSPFKLPGIEEAPEGQYLPDRITDEAIDFIQSHRSRPFFLYLSYYAVHTPLQAPEEKIAAYRATAEGTRQGDPIYAAMVERLDFGIGRILNKLEDLNLHEKTVVIFLSDNGGNRRVTSMDPLRGGKGMLYEGGIRVPLVIRWPGKVGAGTSCEVPVISLDLFPTILEAVEVDPPSAQPMDGVSLLPLLFREGELEPRAMFWHFPAYLEGEAPGARDRHFRTRPAGAVRWGNWKLIEYFEEGDLELYDLEKDLGEKLNLADKHPQKKQELLKLLKAWRAEIKAPVPTDPNPEYIK